MSIGMRVSILLAVAATIFIVQPDCAYACSCRPPGTPSEELGQSDAVFLGRVVEINADRGAITGSGDTTTVTFEISKAWKGQVTQTTTLVTPGSSASCGFTFEQGKEYVVYGRMSEGLLSTNLCSRTRLAGEATEDIAALGAGQPIGSTSQAPQQLPTTAANAFDGQSLVLIFGLFTIAMGMVMMGLYYRGDKKRSPTK